MNIISREMKTTKQEKQINLLEIKNTISEMENSLNGFKNRYIYEENLNNLKIEQ